MRGQFVFLLLVAMLALSAAHNPNKKNKNKFSCFAQCKEECKTAKQVKRQCFIPCKKECPKGKEGKECRKGCRDVPCEGLDMTEEAVTEAKTTCRSCKQKCRPVFKQCWEDNCKTECPDKKAKKVEECRTCLNTNCGGVMEAEEEEMPDSE